MRTKWGTWGLIALAVAAVIPAAQANILIEDFNGPAVSASVTPGGSSGATIAASSSPVDYRAYTLYSQGNATAAVNATTGTLDAVSSAFANITYGMGYWLNGSSFNGGLNTAMNANWSGATAIRFNFASLSGGVTATTTFWTNHQPGGDIYSSIVRGVTLDQNNSFEIPLSSFSPAFDASPSSGAKLSDVDYLYINFAINGLGGSFSLDSIELVTVPEPATGLLVLTGVGALLMRRRSLRRGHIEESK